MTPKSAELASQGSDSDFDADPFHIVGTIVDGRYLVERVVGRGGFAIVYRARHLRFDSPVALKVLHRSLHHNRGRQEEFAQRLLAEGKFLFDLAPLHWSFVRVFEMGSITTVHGAVAPYLALEWLEGATLNDEVRRLRRAGRRLELGQVLALFDGVANGLAIAHARRIAHRDIKPANIFLGLRDDGQVRPRILDFGLAKAMSRSELGMDVFGDSHFSPTPFTPAYGAPEQWQRRLGATGAWTDVHALALLCVELLTAEPPLRGGDTAQLMASCLDERFRPTPRALGVDLPDSVEAVFAQALAIDPRQRHRDARAFWQALCLAAKVSDPERQLPGLTLPLLADSSDGAAAREVHDNQPTAASLTAKSARPPSTAASGEPWGLTGERVRMHSVMSPLQRRLFPVAALLLTGLLLAWFVPARAARRPLPSAPAPSEQRALSAPLVPPAAFVSSSTIVREPRAPAVTSARAPATRSGASATRKPLASTRVESAQFPSAEIASQEPSARPVAPEGASIQAFEVTRSERSDAQLDRMMLEDGLTRRK